MLFDKPISRNLSLVFEAMHNAGAPAARAAHPTQGPHRDKTNRISTMPTGFFGTIIVGAIIGWLASIITKANNQLGCLANMIVGVIGSALGAWLAAELFKYKVMEGFSWPGFFIGIGGAVLFIALLRLLGILRRD